MILHEAHLVATAQVEARCHVEDRATDVRLTLPDAANDAIDVIDLEESMQVQV